MKRESLGLGRLVRVNLIGGGVVGGSGGVS